MFLYDDFMFYLFIKDQSINSLLTFTAACMWTYVIWSQRRSLKKTIALHEALEAKGEALDELFKQMSANIQTQFKEIQNTLKQPNEDGRDE
jgi:uncharacterized membrane protein YccC